MTKMAILLKIATVTTVLTIVYGNQCSWPSNWRENPWMIGVVSQTKHLDILKYHIDGSCSTAISTNPGVQITKCNCPAYSSIQDGTQIYLRALTGRQNTAGGLCVEQRRLDNILLRREGGTQLSIAACQAAISSSNLYTVLLPVDPNMPDGTSFSYRTTWSVSTNVNCPMSGYHAVACQIAGNDACPSESGVTVSGSYMSIIAPGVFVKYPNYPLTGTIECLADLSATALEESASDDKILVLKRNTNSQPDKVYFYCARYRRLSNGTWSLSIDVQNTTHVQCMQTARHDWGGQHGGRDYLRLLFHPKSIESTTRGPVTTPSTPTTTTIATTTTPQQQLHHLQVVIPAMYDRYASGAQQAAALKNDLRIALGEICQIDSDNIQKIYTEQGDQGVIVVTYDIVYDTQSVEECKQKLTDNIKNDRTIKHGNIDMYFRETVHLWNENSMCPDIRCQTGTSCWYRQGDYSCECFDKSANSIGKCPEASVVDKPVNKNRVITFSVVAVAALLVIIAVIVIVIMVRRRQCGKDDYSDDDSVGSLEQQDRDMYSSIGKKPTAFHDKSFIVDDDDDDYHGEKTGIHSMVYM